MTLKAFVRRVYQFHMYMIADAQGKRRGQTKVFPLLLIPLLFLAVVRRFPLESDTDIKLLPVYGFVDVSLLYTFRKLNDVKDFMLFPLIHHARCACHLPPLGEG